MTGSPELRMAADIVRQFPDASDDDVADRLSAHIVKFWDPRMRSRLLTDDVAGHQFADVLTKTQSRLREATAPNG